MNLLRISPIFGVALGLVSCSGTGSIGPCDGFTPPAECGASCQADGDCDAAFYCDGSQCTADCTVGGNQCGDGDICAARGRCVADPTGSTTTTATGGDGDGDCPSVFVKLDPVTPTVQLVIDQSGSMVQSFGNNLDRWEAVGAALFTGFSGSTPIVQEFQSEVIFGATLYSSSNGNQGGTCPVLNEVAPALNNFAALKALYDANKPNDDTPTTETINSVAASFPVSDPDRPGPRIILLATDGEPDTCADPDAHNATTNGLAERAVQAAFDDRGIRTFVLSVGDNVGATHLKRLANAGAGLDLSTGNAKAFVANNPSELADQFAEIIGRVRSCTFSLDGEVDPARTCEGTVVLNNRDLQCNVDWRLNDPRTLEVLGDACDELLANSDILLGAEFPCGSVIIIE